MTREGEAITKVGGHAALIYPHFSPTWPRPVGPNKLSSVQLRPWTGQGRQAHRSDFHRPQSDNLHPWILGLDIGDRRRVTRAGPPLSSVQTPPPPKTVASPLDSSSSHSPSSSTHGKSSRSWTFAGRLLQAAIKRNSRRGGLGEPGAGLQGEGPSTGRRCGVSS